MINTKAKDKCKQKANRFAKARGCRELLEGGAVMKARTQKKKTTLRHLGSLVAKFPKGNTARTNVGGDERKCQRDSLIVATGQELLERLNWIGCCRDGRQLRMSGKGVAVDDDHETSDLRDKQVAAVAYDSREPDNVVFECRKT